MKQQKSTIFLVMMLIVSSLIFLYPNISSYWNSLHQTSVIANYEKNMKNLDNENYEEIISSAKEYNEYLASLLNQKFENGSPVDENYLNQLKVEDDDNIMGYISIDKIDVYLAIYHGTSSSVLAAGTGHLEGSSLPIGGESTHTVITGHRGLPTAILFTNLDLIEIDDVFTLNILSETLTYQVDQILIVPPNDVKDIKITQGEDYCTLVTCTPFGINTDRILVRGTRIENIKETNVQITNEADAINPMIVALVIAVALIFVYMLVIFCIPTSKKGK